MLVIAMVGMMQTAWGQLADAPAEFGPGAALSACRGDLFAIRGGGTRDFWRYHVDLNKWSRLSALPYPADESASLTTNGTDLFALAGSTLCRYEIDTDVWTEFMKMHEPCGPGAGVAACGSGFIVTRGGGSRDVWKLGAGGELVASLTLPGPVDRGGSLRYSGSKAHIIAGGGGCLRYIVDLDLIETSQSVLNFNVDYSAPQATADDFVWVMPSTVPVVFGGPINTDYLEPLFACEYPAFPGSALEASGGRLYLVIGGTPRMRTHAIHEEAAPSQAPQRSSKGCGGSASGTASWMIGLLGIVFLARRSR